MNIIKKNKYLILSFIIPIIILTSVFICKGIFYKNIILTSDMHEQYYPLFNYLYNVLHGKANFPYTFSKGLGGTMYGTFFYILSSPLNLLVYFFNDISLFITLLIILKISLCGLTMFIFLNHKYKENNYTVLIFSLAYALMGYNINYYVNIMWLDGVILLPLILLGIDKVIYNKKYLLYIICLFSAIIANYYIGYMLFLFSIIYFLYNIYTSNNGDNLIKEKKKLIIHFLLITILIGFMTMFILLPTGLESMNYIRIDGQIKLINLKYLDLLSGTYIGFGNLSNPLNYYGFLIYSGTAIIPLIIYYFTSKSISKKEKKATAIIYIIFLLPIIITPLNAIWHLFTFPQGFNYRYSFITTMFNILIAFKSFNLMDGSKKAFKYYYIIYIICSCSLIYITIITPEYYFYLNPIKIIFTVVLIGINIYLIIKKYKKMVLGLLIIELISNFIWINVESDLDNKIYIENVNKKNNLLSQYCNDINRCESITSYSFNDSILGNYNGISIFLSSLNNNIVAFYNKAIGIKTNTNYQIYLNYDYILDTMLGVEYILDTRKTDNYTIINTLTLNNKKFNLLKNDNALSLGYLVDDSIKNFKSSKKGYPYLNDILEEMDNTIDDYINEVKINKINDYQYQLNVSQNNSYFYLYSDINNFNIKDIVSADDYGIIFYNTNDNKVTLTFDQKPTTVIAYEVNMDALKQFKNKRTELVITKNKGNYLKGTINVTQNNNILFTTIPYEKGWNIYVDGQKVPYFKVLDTFIGIDLNKGYHLIEFKYKIPGLFLGIIISISSFGLLVLLKYRYLK